MIRAQRRRHLVIWLILGPLVLLGLVLGWSARREMPVAGTSLDESIVDGELFGGTEVSP